MLRWSWPAWLAVLVLAACGGGGGGSADSGPVTRTALPSLSQDLDPSGERFDYRDRNYFPLAAGDNWTYDRQQGGASTGQTVTRRADAGAGADVVITETSLGETTRETFRRTSQGIFAVLPLAGEAPDAVARFVGDLLEYPEPFYTPGAMRRVVRQGDWGIDEDGDGVSESYRIEFSQVLVGLETVNLPSGQVKDSAHFRNVTTFTLQPSNPKRAALTVTGTEDTWWGPGLGLVRTEVSVIDAVGTALEPAYVLVLTDGNVGGKKLFAPKSDGTPTSGSVGGKTPLEPTIDGTLTKIALLHNALVFDRTRGRYYASVPGSVAANGNRIAVVDAATGAVNYSAAIVGSEPGALALSADGGALYVGLNGSGDVAKLRLPDMAELWRVRLPAVNFFGQLFAERIVVSPQDPDVVAVSMYRVSVSPRHGGVALVRGGVVQPVQTQDHTGSNLIAFDASGHFVYGLNTESTEFGLRRIAVLADGLREEQVVTTAGRFGGLSLDWSPSGLVLDTAVYRAPDLTLRGTVGVEGGGCRRSAVPDRLVCAFNPAFDSSADKRLAVVDANTFGIVATPLYQRGADSNTATWRQLVPGPTDQVALRMNTTSPASQTDSVWLFTSPALQ